MLTESIERLLGSNEEMNGVFDDIPAPKAFTIEQLRIWLEQFKLGVNMLLKGLERWQKIL